MREPVYQRHARHVRSLVAADVDPAAMLVARASLDGSPVDGWTTALFGAARKVAEQRGEPFPERAGR